MRSLLVIAALTVACAYGIPSDYGRIVGGTVVADETEFPYLVSISEDDAHICGGFIYNDRWIATAASCLDGKSTSNLLVKVGSISLITPGPEEQLIPVFEIIINPNYDNATGINDIALLQTSRPIVFNDYAKAIRYDEVLQTIDGVVSNEIAGWGATFEGGIVATKLRKATISDVDNGFVSCQSFGDTLYKPNYMICAGDANASPCDFDEGTPLVQVYADKKIVVGVMSKAAPQCAPGSPSLYARLSAYYYWLLQTAGQQPAGTY